MIHHRIVLYLYKYFELLVESLTGFCMNLSMQFPICTRICLYQGQVPKELVRQRFAELSGELSGAICLKTLVLLCDALKSFRKLFGAVRAILWFWGYFFGS